mgnify:CR=1 FL=1
MSNSDIEQSGTVKGHLPNEASLSGRISNGLSLSGRISIGSGSSDFIIKMTVEFKGSELIVTSCDTTVEQIDEAVAAEKRVVVVASFDGTILELPMVQGDQGYSYYFCAILSESVLLSSVYKTENTSDWSFGMINIRDITADDISYPNSFGEGAPENVGQALDVLMTGFNATRKDILRLNKSEHTHSNKSVLDKFAETDGKPTYDGKALGGGTSDFIIKMTIASGDNGGYTLASCDATIEQIDAAVAAEKRVVVIASADGISFELPMLQGAQGVMYAFGTFLNGQMMTSFVEKIDESTSKWQFLITQIEAESVNYSNNALPNIANVRGALNELVPKSHTHTNKPVLDKFAELDGKPTYNGETLSGGADDLIIKMTLEDNGGNITVASCDATIDQIDAAVAAEKRAIVIASFSGDIIELPMLQGAQGDYYSFGTFLGGAVYLSSVYKDGNTSIWDFRITLISAGNVAYYNDALSNVTDVEGALNKLVSNSHTHANKDALDKLSDSNGKLQYNGSDVGLKGDKGDTPVKGTDYWTAADKTEIVNDTLAALPTWTGGGY